MKKDRILGVVLARGGSKSVPLKNIVDCGGKPLIYWTIKSALDSGVIDKLIVSTDNAQIIGVSEKYGAVCAARPKRFCEDETPSFDALKWTVEWAEQRWETVWPMIAELPATNPLKTGEDVRTAVELMKRNLWADSVASVSLVVNHPSRVKAIVDRVSEPKIVSYCDGCGEVDNRKQDLKSAYERNGAVYVMKRETLFEKGDRFGDLCVPYLMSKMKSINIDDEFDLLLANLLLKERLKK